MQLILESLKPGNADTGKAGQPGLVSIIDTEDAARFFEILRSGPGDAGSNDESAFLSDTLSSNEARQYVLRLLLEASEDIEPATGDSPDFSDIRAVIGEFLAAERSEPLETPTIPSTTPESEANAVIEAAEVYLEATPLLSAPGDSLDAEAAPSGVGATTSDRSREVAVPSMQTVDDRRVQNDGVQAERRSPAADVAREAASGALSDLRDTTMQSGRVSGGVDDVPRAIPDVSQPARDGTEFSQPKEAATDKGAQVLPPKPELRMPDRALADGEKVPAALEDRLMQGEPRIAPSPSTMSPLVAGPGPVAVTQAGLPTARDVIDRQAVRTGGLTNMREEADHATPSRSTPAAMSSQTSLVAPGPLQPAFAPGAAVGQTGEGAPGFVEHGPDALLSGTGDPSQPGTSERARAEPVAARSIVDQVVRLMTRAPGDGVIEIRLQPEELGRVRLSMTPTELGVTVQITAERYETLDLLRRNIDLLEADLLEQGFANLTFDFGSETAGDDTPGFDAGSEPDRREAQTERQGLGVELTQYTPQLAEGRIDIRI